MKISIFQNTANINFKTTRKYHTARIKKKAFFGSNNFFKLRKNNENDKEIVL